MFKGKHEVEEQGTFYCYKYRKCNIAIENWSKFLVVSGWNTLIVEKPLTIHTGSMKGYHLLRNTCFSSEKGLIPNFLIVISFHKKIIII